MSCVRATCKQEIIWLSEMESKKETAEGERPDTEPPFDRFRGRKDGAAAAVHLKEESLQYTNNPIEQGQNSSCLPCVICIRAEAALTSPAAQRTSTRASCPAGRTAAWRHWRWRQRSSSWASPPADIETCESEAASSLHSRYLEEQVRFY